MLSKTGESQYQSPTAAVEATAPGILFVVSSPSGGGKGTLVQRVLKTVENLSYSVSYTTRTPRNGEVNGREYFFVTAEVFQQMIAANEFLEWAPVHGKLYGTGRSQVTRVGGAQLGRHRPQVNEQDEKQQAEGDHSQRDDEREARGAAGRRGHAPDYRLGNQKAQRVGSRWAKGWAAER